MNRSAFLKSLLGKGFVVTLPFLAKAKEKQLTEVLIMQEYVAGFQYGEGEKYFKEMKVFDELHLIREPDNQYDALAIAVYWKLHRIGYVPAIDTKLPNNFMLKGLPLKAKIDKLNNDSAPWRKCKLGLYLLYPQELLKPVEIEVSADNPNKVYIKKSIKLR